MIGPKGVAVAPTMAVHGIELSRQKHGVNRVDHEASSAESTKGHHDTHGDSMKST